MTDNLKEMKSLPLIGSDYPNKSILAQIMLFSRIHPMVINGGIHITP
jgi:hypothetical protein